MSSFCQAFFFFKFFSDVRQDREKFFNTSLCGFFFLNSRSARFSQTLFYVYGVFVYLSVCISVYHKYLVSAEAILGYSVSWEWSSIWL